MTIQLAEAVSPARVLVGLGKDDTAIRPIQWTMTGARARPPISNSVVYFRLSAPIVTWPFASGTIQKAEECNEGVATARWWLQCGYPKGCAVLCRTAAWASSSKVDDHVLPADPVCSDTSTRLCIKLFVRPWLLVTLTVRGSLLSFVLLILGHFHSATTHDDARQAPSCILFNLFPLYLQPIFISLYPPPVSIPAFIHLFLRASR